jgi:superfamily II DNA/RNA helicase
MLDMGFEPQIRKIVEQVRVSILFYGYELMTSYKFILGYVELDTTTTVCIDSFF